MSPPLDPAASADIALLRRLARLIALLPDEDIIDTLRPDKRKAIDGPGADDDDEDDEDYEHEHDLGDAREASKAQRNKEAIDDDDDDEYDDEEEDEEDENIRLGEESRTTFERTRRGSAGSRDEVTRPKQKYHAAKEQRYRSGLNNKLQQLHNMIPYDSKFVPSADGDQLRAKCDSSDTQVSRPVILDQVIGYIDHLVRVYTMYERDLDALRCDLRSLVWDSEREAGVQHI